jgi:hypothetical protein
MTRPSFQIATTALIGTLLSVPVCAFAQSETSTREGNVWGWRDHQPTKSEVARKEKSAGIAPMPSRQDYDSATVDDLYRQLMQREPK